MKNSKHRALSIKWKILAYMIVILIVVQFSVALISGEESNKMMRDAVKVILESEVSRLEAIADQWNDNAWAMADAIHDLPEVRAALKGGSIEAAGDALSVVLKNNINLGSYNLYANTVLLDKNFTSIITGKGFEGVGLQAMSIPPFVPNCEQALKGNRWVSQVTPSPVTGIMECWYSKPVFEDNEFLGMVVVPVHTEGVTRYLQANMSSAISATFIADEFGMIASSTNPDLIGKNMSELNIPVDEVSDNTFYEYVSSEGKKEMVHRSVTLPDTRWHAYSILDVNKAFSYRHVIVGLIVAVLACVLGAILMHFIISRIMRPIASLNTAARDISRGNLNVQLTKTSDDELGSLTDSFIMMRNTIRELADKIIIVSKYFEQGDLDKLEIDTNCFSGEYKSIAESVNGTIGKLISDVLEMLGKFTELGNGNFSVTLPAYPGKRAVANEVFNSVKVNLSKISTDITQAATAATQGDLTFTIDTDKYQGDWRVAADKMNELLLAIEQPIEESNRILAKLSEGDFDINISKNYKGSFYDMMASLDKMSKSISGYIGEITDVLSAISAGDLSRSITNDFVGQYNRIKISINNIAGTLSGTISEIQTSADYVLSAATKISEFSDELARDSQQQSETVKELGSSISVVSEQIQKTTNEAQSVFNYSLKSIDNARDCNDEMRKMLTSMNEIKAASGSIAKIIKVIDDIAFQTNLLALNAAVEAAKAGTHGKGFVVVAEQVRTLAGRSKQAAQNITALIDDTMTKIDSGANTAQATANSLQVIIADINAVSDIINQIFDATRTQVDSISQIVSGVDQISEAVNRNSSTSHESAITSQELNKQSALLGRMVNKFNI